MSKYSRFWLLSMAMLIGSASPALAQDNSFVKVLSSESGAVVIACITALSSGISSFIWAFDWTRAGVSDKENKRVQEGGGIANAATSIVLAGVIPTWIYFHKKHHASRVGQVYAF